MAAPYRAGIRSRSCLVLKSGPCASFATDWLIGFIASCCLLVQLTKLLTSFIVQSAGVQDHMNHNDLLEYAHLSFRTNKDIVSVS
jgi:hypothetical protein